MEPNDDKRRELRIPAMGVVYVTGETVERAFETKGELRNISPRGMAFDLRDRLPEGSIVWCAVPSLSVYERAQVCHSASSSFNRKTVGVRFLASGLPREAE